MNILFSTPMLSKSSYLTFGAKPKATEAPKLEPLTCDVFEAIGSQEGMPPQKIELTSLEQEYNEVLLERNRVQRNLRTQKEMLRDYYSSNDKEDYKELQREKRKLDSKMRRIAQKAGVAESYEVEINIDLKKEYNRFAPKLYKAQTLEELEQAKGIVFADRLYSQVDTMLRKLFDLRLKQLV